MLLYFYAYFNLSSASNWINRIKLVILKVLNYYPEISKREKKKDWSDILRQHALLLMVRIKMDLLSQLQE